MSRTRQARAPIVSVVEMERPVVAFAQTYADGYSTSRHRHRSGQLIYAVSGVMTVTTRDGTWVVPAQRAVWVPPLVDHTIRMTGTVEMRTLYLLRELASTLPTACCVVHVTPLLRELVLRTVGFQQPYPQEGSEARMVAVLVDEIRAAAVAPLHLPLPTDSRALRVARALLSDPADVRTLSSWMATAGASGRTLARIFQRETGMSFGAWRQQLRLLRGLERLAAGEAVTSLALELGYDSPSAFIAMFRKALGVSPGRYFRNEA